MRRFGFGGCTLAAGVLVAVLASLGNEEEFLSAGWEATPWSSCSAMSPGSAVPAVPAGCTAGTQTRTVSCDPLGLPCQGPTPVSQRLCVTGEVCGWAVGAWSSCSYSCGEQGVQQRQAICLSNLPGACPDYPYPLTQECTGTLACEWWRSDWSACSAACGQGLQSRGVACLDPSGCSGSPPPSTSQACTGTACHWTVGPWGSCTAQRCGETGAQHRDVRCDHDAGCSGTAPSSRQSCSSQPCAFLEATSTSTVESDATTEVTGRRIALATTTTSTHSTTTIQLYDYFVGDWTACSALCGMGTRTREVYCHKICSRYRCPEESQAFCDAASLSKPPALEGCYGAPPPCRTSTTEITSTRTTLLPTSTISTTTPIPLPGDVECVTAPIVIAASTCLDSGPSLCGPLCPCCRLRQPTPAPTPAPTPPPAPTPAPTGRPLPGVVSPADSESPSLGWILAVAGFAGAGFCFLLGLTYMLCRLTRSRTTEVTELPPSLGKGKLNQGGRTVPEAWPGSESTDDYYDGEGPAGFTGSFRDPPDADFDFFHRSPHDPPDMDADFQRAFHDPPEPDADIPRRFRRSEADTDFRRSYSEPADVDMDSGRPGGRPQPQPQPQFVPGSRGPAEHVQGQGQSQSHSPSQSPFKSKQSPSPTSRRRQAHAAAAETFAQAPPKKHGSPTGSGAPPPTSPSSTASPEGPGRGARPRPSGQTTPPREKPPSDSEDEASAREASGKAAGSSGKPQAPPEDEAKPARGTRPAPTSEVADIIAKIDAELDSSRAKDLEWRRRHFRELMLRWHPDKNKQENAQQAAEVFRHVMARRGGYLDV